jgi:hypothetical protein
VWLGAWHSARITSNCEILSNHAARNIFGHLAGDLGGFLDEINDNFEKRKGAIIFKFL